MKRLITSINQNSIFLQVVIIPAISLFHFRHWAAIPSDVRGHPAKLPPMRSPDGTYLASEFNYTLSRQHKGYDIVGNKHFHQDINIQLDPRFATVVKPDRQTDKGYYCDRTYESPICVASQEKDPEDQQRLRTNSYTHETPCVKIDSGTAVVPRTNTPFMLNSYVATENP